MSEKSIKSIIISGILTLVYAMGPFVWLLFTKECPLKEDGTYMVCHDMHNTMVSFSACTGFLCVLFLLIWLPALSDNPIGNKSCMILSAVRAVAACFLMLVCNISKYPLCASEDMICHVTLPVAVLWLSMFCLAHIASGIRDFVRFYNKHKAIKGE